MNEVNPLSWTKGSNLGGSLQLLGWGFGGILYPLGAFSDTDHICAGHECDVSITARCIYKF